MIDIYYIFSKLCLQWKELNFSKGYCILWYQIPVKYFIKIYECFYSLYWVERQAILFIVFICIFSKTNSLTDSISLSEFIQMTVCDSWSMSRRRKSTASSSGGYLVTMKAAFFKKDYNLNDTKAIWNEISTR